MFSGIIDAVARARACDPTPGGLKLTVSAPGYWTDVQIGASVAIDGVCLTLTGVQGDDADFDVITETLQRTTLGDLRPGGRVNLQKALTAADRIDGHFVQGHVDAVATVAKVERTEREAKWWFAMDAAPMAYVIPKGSVAVDGISLTVVDVREDQFSVALIPTTLERTTLGDKKVADRVNVETDILARTVVHTLESIAARSGGDAAPLTIESLRRHGFT